MSLSNKQSTLIALTLIFGGIAATAAPLLTGVVNSASYASAPVAPGEIVTVFGTGLGPASLVVQKATDRFGSSLSGVQVTFNGIAAPLLYVSPTQIGAIVPYGVAGSDFASVQVIYQGAKSNVLASGVVASALGIFTGDASGKGQGAVLNGDYSLNSASNPAAPGDVVMVFATGEGVSNPAVGDGMLVPSTAPMPMSGITANIGGLPAKVLYAGGSPGLVAGLIQVNVEVPSTISACLGGGVPLALSSAGQASQFSVTLQVAGKAKCGGPIFQSLTFQALGAGKYTGLVTLMSPAPAGGLTVSLLSTSTAFTVPATVTVPAGAKSTTFPATTPVGSARTSVVVTAMYAGDFAQANVTAAPASVIMANVQGGTFIPSDGSQRGLISGAFGANGSGGYKGNITIVNTASPSFMVSFDDASLIGDTMVADRFTVALGSPTNDMVQQGANFPVQVSGVSIRVKIGSFDPTVFLKTITGTIAVAYNMPVIDPKDPKNPKFFTPSVLSGTFTTTGLVSVQ